ncbi:MAG: zinc-dependent alcohol dehydrogenase [Anaerolineae bacterium]|jgi:2-desacetyl-2-hydroxyethyl bacteriochlorophyllide A dehydrogenase|nr:alcohol dehydrogenase catalytic domain-containing protein [Chloroflexota bacterium]
MRAAYFRGNEVIELVDIPKPELAPGEVLIRVGANGVCGSDRKILRGGHDLVPGHEVSGTVVEVTPGCTTPIGARVAVYIPRYCGVCEYCQSGRGNLCPNKPGLLGWATNGGYAEYMALPERNALRIDDRLTLDQGVLLLDTLGTSSHGLRLARAAEAGSALVIGAGPVGMGAVAYLRAVGVPDVYVSELSDYRLEVARGYGAIPVNPSREDLETRIRDSHPYGVDLVVEAVGSLPTIWQSFDMVRPGGRISLVGEYWGPITYEGAKRAWMINDITLIRSFYFTIPEFYENQQMILDGKLNTAPLASHSYPLEQIAEAYKLFATGNSVKIMVRP